MAEVANNVTVLKNVLMYHVTPGSIMKSMAINEAKLTMLNGKGARMNIYPHNNVVTIQGETISEFDIMASNGVIRVLDGVMMQTTFDIVDYVAGNGNLSTLLSLVQQAGLATALRGDALTLFAPTNDAFAKLPAEQVSLITSTPELLASVLTFHVVGSTEYSAGLWKREHLPTLNPDNQTLTVSFPHYGHKIKIKHSTVTMADIGTTNGVVHLIDHVLIPKSLTEQTVSRWLIFG